MKIAFALLADRMPLLVERLVKNLISAGHLVVLHYDQKSPDEQFDYLARNLAGSPTIRFAKRVRVRWGQWSIVAATLNCLQTIEDAGWEPDYVYLLSGTDYPIRPSRELVRFLERNRGMEFIEGLPADGANWVKTGPQQERYQYRFFYNWREQRYRFEISYALQRILGLKRQMVRCFEPYIGSQWWVLSWQTLRKVMDLARQPDIIRFFRTTLIPDELFFQTLVRHLVPESRIVNRTLTLYQFSDYGCPVVYYSDHFEYLIRQPFFMARKLSPYCNALRDRLDSCWRGEVTPLPFDDHEAGVVGSEYEDWRFTYRDGAPGCPVPGRSYGRWYEDHERLRTPFFVLIGTSSAELRLFQRALAQNHDVLCHGQLFHPKSIEFAAGRPCFGGYAADDLELRAHSAPQFLADVIRSERRRTSGFLLRWGQGWHITELVCDRPNARVLILRGDPLIAFSENALGTEPLLANEFDPSVLQDIPAIALARRFRRFLQEYQRHVDWLRWLARRSEKNKPQGWLGWIDLDVASATPKRARARHGAAAAANLARTEPASVRAEVLGSGAVRFDPMLARWRSYAGTTQACLGVGLGGDGSEQAKEIARLQERRRLITERLLEGGISKVVLDTLQQGPNGPRFALALS